MTREEAINRLRDMTIEISDYCNASKHMSEADRQDMETFDVAIKALEQEPRWIPITEDIPPKGTICLWCNKQGSVFTSAITYRSENNSYVGKHGYFSNGLENYGDIIAWMPLPNAYKKEVDV